MNLGKEKYPNMEEKTEIIGKKKAPEESRTVFVDRELKEKEYQPVIHLVDKKNGGRAFQGKIEGCIVIGRKEELCDIALTYDNTVSSRQCRIYTEENACYVMDLGGTNRTYLNDQPVKEDQVIRDGDVLGFGRVDLHVSIWEE